MNNLKSMNLNMNMNLNVKGLGDMKGQFSKFVGIKEKKDAINHGDYKDLYKTADQYLEAITQKINVYEAIYECVNVYVLPTISIEDEYVVVVLRIMSEELQTFFGGHYLIQQWAKKQKIFQAVHHNKPRSFFLNQQRFVYSLQGIDEECSYLYVSNFYQSIFQKIKNPFFNPENSDGIHDCSVYVDPKQVLIANGFEVQWAQLKIESLISQSMETPAGKEINVDEVETIVIETEVQFKDLLENCQSPDKPQDINKVHCVSSEGYMRKEVHIVVESAMKIHILQLTGTRAGSFDIIEKFAFEKSFIEIGVSDAIKRITLENYSDQENMIVIHMANNQIKVFSESIELMMIEYAANVKAAQEDDDDETDEEEKAKYQQALRDRQRPCSRIKAAFREPPPLENPSGKRKAKPENNQAFSAIKNFFAAQIKKNFFKVDFYFMRRQFIYFKGSDGELKRINMNDIKNQDPIAKSYNIKYPLQVAMLKDVTIHVNIFNDFLLANTTLIISHQKVLSIFDFLSSQWRHMLPQEQGNREQLSNQTYFGMPADEIDSLLLNYVFSNSIYDCIIKYRGKFIRRLKYYNDLDKQFFEKGLMFQDQKVLQMQRNIDSRNYRQYGDSTIRTMFLIEDQKLGIQQVWVTENGSRITKLVDQIPIEEQWQLVEIPNARSDMLIVHSGKQRTITVYEIPNPRQCLYPAQLAKYKKHEINRIDYDASQKIQYFIFFDKIYYQSNGNLVVLNLNSKTNQTTEFNFNGQIREMYMTHQDSVYYKDKNNIFRFANLKMQKQFNVDKQPTEVINCRGAFCTRIEYSISMNRIAIFTSSFEVSIFPLLDRNRVDLMASQDFESNYLCWKEVENKLIALKKPNVLVTWNTDSGKIEGYQKIEGFDYEKFKRHTEWNGCTLLKQIKEAKVENPKRKKNKDKVASRYEMDEEDESFDYEGSDADFETEEQKARFGNEHLHKYSLIEIVSPTEIIEHCQFLHDYEPGTYLYVSFPYLLVMDDVGTKMYLIEGKTKFKSLRLLNTFYEPQMKIGKPLYFSQNFYHRIFIDPHSKDIIINFTLTNTNICNLSIRKLLMFQVEKTHPMIYFHDDDKIVYTTIHGVEKLFKIEKVLGNRRRKGECKLIEVANIYYNEKSFVRRYILDPLSFNHQQASQMEKLDILKFRGDIIKRNLYFNIYLDTLSESKKKSLPRFYHLEKNVSSFNHFIINNYRQEMTFSYITWKIIENMGKKKISIKDFKPEFLNELCFVITPDFKNILHLLSKNYEVLDQFIAYVNNENLEEDQQHLVTLNDILFIPDLKGKTPLHYSLKTNNARVTDRLVKALSLTDFDHHNRFIIDTYAKMIEIVPQSMSVYLQNRMKTPAWIAHYSRGRIEPENDCEFVMTADQIWKDTLDQSLQDKMYSPEALEVPLEMYILDLPHMHKYQNKHADDFLEALADTEQIDIFSNIAVKALIELKWPLVKAAIKKFLFYPYLIFLLSFLIYTVVVFEDFHRPAAEPTPDPAPESTVESSNSTTVVLSAMDQFGNLKNINIDDIANQLKDPKFWLSHQMTILKVIIMFFTTYFFVLEIRQMFLAGMLKYLGSPWNYLDMIPLFLITFSMFFDRYGADPKYERPLNAIACFFMWIKFLYFWRIFRKTSKFISMIIAIIGDMKEFLVVFFVTLIAFGQSMYIMSNNNSTSDQLKEQGITDENEIAQKQRFIHSMTDSVFFAFRMSLGDFDTSQLGQVHKTLVIIMFVLSTLFLTIMMLNLLIAVISDSYARVESTSVEEMYKNLADLIAENEYLVREKQLVAHDDMGDYLYIAKVDKTEGADETGLVIQEINDSLVKKTEGIEKLLREAQRALVNQVYLQTENYLSHMKDSNIKNDMRIKQFIKRNESFQKKDSVGGRNRRDSGVNQRQEHQERSSSPVKKEEKQSIFGKMKKMGEEAIQDTRTAAKKVLNQKSGKSGLDVDKALGDLKGNITGFGANIFKR